MRFDLFYSQTQKVKDGSRTTIEILCIWWDIKGVLYYEILETSQTVTTERYGRQIRAGDTSAVLCCWLLILGRFLLMEYLIY